MNPLELIQKYYEPKSLAYRILVEHSQRVAEKAMRIADRLGTDGIDVRFLEEAALLHDIGILYVNEPQIGCHGDRPYVCHGYLGRELLEKEGLPRHAIVCETHVGVGITREEIQRHGLPLPARDMLPQTLEETIIAFADKFYTKHPDHLDEEKTPDEIRRRLAKYGPEKVAVFNQWLEMFGG